jgi:N-acetylmuramoyl-L-alanine amidase
MGDRKMTVVNIKTVAACAAGLLILAGVLVGVLSAPADAGEATRVRFGAANGDTRIVIDLTDAASPKVFTPEGNTSSLILAMPRTTAKALSEGVGQGAVETWAVDEAAGAARFAFTLSGPVEVRRSFLIPPQDGIDHYRYVVDLAPKAVMSAQSAPAPVKKPNLMSAVFTMPKAGKKVIVIDAGHGGKDPGARGGNGLYEKDVNLSAALALKKRLERTKRYTVVLTRDTDVFIELKDRVRIARAADADLFISLHSDSGPAGARGASVYTLSEQASTRVANAISNDHDWFMDADYGAKDKDVARILVDLTQRETKNQSSAFALKLTGTLGSVTPLLRNTNRQAGFVVLLAPDVPAVLLEMGFVSNPEDEKLLGSKSGRARMMDAVGDAIDAYFEGREMRVASK